MDAECSNKNVESLCRFAGTIFMTLKRLKVKGQKKNKRQKSITPDKI